MWPDSSEIISCGAVTPNNRSDPPRLLNYLTAPHVLVWSAAVASSSLPGVFEANRLMVKDADGTVRYESSERASFSDGSMEQDLPMQQLSEMFNVNHFIISQANPHAVMFASYNHFRNVWSNPVAGFINAVLTFLKERCKSWISQVVQLVGTRRIAPQHATSRIIGSQFFVQEYEGRDCDISLIPWIKHRGLISALMHCLYNPSEAEFREWIAAAERETWKHLPAIKSHIAEEVTLDRCVQRLRQRLLIESWEKRRAESTHQKMGERVPSFFTSPSLVHLGGLGISDQTQLEGLEGHQEHAHTNSAADPPSAPMIPPLDISHGWRGLGLQGNRSSGSLEQSPSVASGLFIDADDGAAVEQVAGEQSVPSASRNPTSLTVLDNATPGYTKTTNMARFYYQNSSSYGSLPRTVHVGHGEGSLQKHRRKSKSHTDMMGKSLISSP